MGQETSRKILECRFDQVGGSLVWIAGAVEFHGAITLVGVLLQISEGSLHINTSQFAILAEFHSFHVTDVIGLREHGVDSGIALLRAFGGERVAEIGQSVKPGVVDLVYELHQEERIFTHGIIVFQVNEDVLGSGVIRDASKGIGSTVEIGLGIRCRMQVGADTNGTDSGGDIDPLLAERDGFLALGRIGSIRTVSAVDGHVYDPRPSFFQRRSKYIEILWVGGREVPGPGLNFVDVESLDHVSAIIFEVNRGIAPLVFLASDELTEGI